MQGVPFYGSVDGCLSGRCLAIMRQEGRRFVPEDAAWHVEEYAFLANERMVECHHRLFRFGYHVLHGVQACSAERACVPHPSAP